MSKKILVTGGLGYIGSHTVVELLSRNFQVVIADNLSNSSIEILERIAKISNKKPLLEIIDFCDEKKTNDFLSKHQDIKAIIHFAAFKSVGESVSNPLKYYKNNLASLINILEGMAKYNISNIVFSSSCTVYGQPENLPVNEQAPVQKALSPYGNTKQISEEILQESITSNSKIQCISLRYFNPIGAHPSSLIGELPNGIPENLLPFITQTAAGIRGELKVFGNDYDTPDGTCIRDYIDVNDLARAHLSAIDRLLSGQNKKLFEIFNLGTGQGVSVLEMIETFQKVSGEKINYQIAGRRQGDIEKVWADPSHANRELGWKAQISLEETLKSAWNWEKKFRNIEK
jgi:UDP-glucose 4-epimerase